MLQIDGAAFENLNPPPQIDQTNQRIILDQVDKWNRRHLEDSRNDDTHLTARIANYELAFRMQMAAPELIDISQEPEQIKKMYGLNEEPTKKFGRMCLLARRMVERGVRFVQLYNMDWDGHAECEKNHQKNAWKIDKPIAGLLGDLKQRGLLESTLIVWTGEFGRTPIMQGKQGRDHNPYGFCTWMAGGGIRGGKVIGATDELGFRAVEDKVHVNDLHATMLWLLGLDHKKLTYFLQGRDQRLTDVGGENNLGERLLRG
jgi:membrane-anchored protein YejM (alkaline phosphatase superfamily)